jgi:hypothetical protein
MSGSAKRQCFKERTATMEKRMKVLLSDGQDLMGMTFAQNEKHLRKSSFELYVATKIIQYMEKHNIEEKFGRDALVGDFLPARTLKRFEEEGRLYADAIVKGEKPEQKLWS